MTRTQDKVKPPGRQRASPPPRGHLGSCFNSGIWHKSFGPGRSAEEVARALVGAVAKEGRRTSVAAGKYCETVARAVGRVWKEFYGAAKVAHPRLAASTMALTPRPARALSACICSR